MTDNSLTAKKAEDVAQQSKKKRPRLFYLDLVRALAAILIVITHFNNPYMLGHPVFMYEPFGIYVGSLGVSLFLIISGAALMYTYGESDKLDCRHFYYKRFIGIYPMFWIAFILANAFLFLRNGGHVLASAPKWSLIFSVLGIDGMVANTSFPTFYTLGEWFLGFILIYYALFPLLRCGVKKHPIITVIIALALYAATLILQPTIFGLPSDLLMTTRLPELLFGMYFIQYIQKVPTIAGAGALLVLIIQELHPLLKGSFAVTVVGIGAFLVIVYAAKWLDVQPVRVPVKSIAKYSYPIFLVHHVLIAQVFTIVDCTALSPFDGYLLFFADFLIIMALAVGLFKLEKATVQYVRSMFATGNRR